MTIKILQQIFYSQVPYKENSCKEGILKKPLQQTVHKLLFF